MIAHVKYCLGIESTAHTFGCAVVTFEGTILSNEKNSFTTEKGGMIPTDVAAHHNRVKESILSRALAAANVDMSDMSLISLSNSPGLSPSLLVGLAFARELSEKNKIPLIGANHSMAHLTIGNLMCGVSDPVYVYVSGPNTQVIARAGSTYRVFGETLDVGLGNMLDKFARDMGLGFPGGPKIEALAKGGSYVELPYSVKGMDVSFAGILTKATRLVEQGARKEDLCYSLQEVCFAMLCEVAERALAHTGKKEVLLIGGVGANKRLCAMLDRMCVDRGAKFFAVPLQYAGDQAAMIAWQGILNVKGGLPAVVKDIFPYERIDEVPVVWD